jgi:antirestriction protein ArdC
MKDIPMKKQEKAPRDHYQDVTQQVIEALEAGTPPWRQPWDSGKAGGPSMPQNAVTGAGYRGINVLTLGVNRAAFMTGDPRWATYKQAQERGWQVMQGSRGVTGYFYKRIEIDGAKSGGESAGEGGKWFPMLRSFTLFHASQIDGIPDYLPPTLEEAPWRAPDFHQQWCRGPYRRSARFLFNCHRSYPNAAGRCVPVAGRLVERAGP